MIVTTLALLGVALGSGMHPPATDASPSPIQEARDACRAHDFNSFLDVFIQSPEVRRQYDARERTVGPGQRGARIRPTAAGRFEIAMVEYDYADEASVRRREANEAPYIWLWIDRIALPGGGWRVDYQPAIFRDDGEGDGRTLVRRTGKRRSYIFLPYRGCWHLARQVR